MSLLIHLWHLPKGNNSNFSDEVTAIDRVGGKLIEIQSETCSGRGLSGKD